MHMCPPPGPPSSGGHGCGALADRAAAPAGMTGQSVRTMRRRITEGSLPAYRFGSRRIRVTLDGLQALGRRIRTVSDP